MANQQPKTCSLSTNRKQDAIEFRLLFALSFVIFLVAMLVARCLPWTRRSGAPGPGGRRSIIGEARTLAHATLPYAFMA